MLSSMTKGAISYLCVFVCVLYLKSEYLVGRCQVKVNTLELAPLYKSAHTNTFDCEKKCHVEREIEIKDI